MLITFAILVFGIVLRGGLRGRAEFWYNISLMIRYFILFCCLSAVFAARASWYWPFGSSEPEPPRLSELMEPASLLIDEASDLAADGKVSEAVEKYRQALRELNRIEAENPERVEQPEFATLKTKRAYVSAAIDSMLLTQAQRNAKPVAVSDTRELEKKLAAERGYGVKASEKPEKDRRIAEELPEVQLANQVEKTRNERKVEKKKKKSSQSKTTTRTRPMTRNEAVMKAIELKDFAQADRLIDEMLSVKTNDVSALNLKAMRLAAESKYKEAEAALDAAISSNPRDYHAYYNMAIIYLEFYKDNKSGARRFYETGRIYGGPKDESIEGALK